MTEQKAPERRDNTSSDGPARSWADRLDAWSLAHPRTTWCATVALAVVATLVLLAQSRGAVVLYQAF